MGEWIQHADTAVTQWAGALGWPLEQMLRLALATVAGGLVGLEREVRGRQAGFRTNVLVCVGSALVMIVSSALGSRGPWMQGSGYQVTVDPGRIAYGVMAGIGFLGAGTILHLKGAVHGLTTAAALWCVAAIGLGLGFGLYLVAAAAVVLVLAALWLLDYLESVLPTLHSRVVTVRRAWQPGCIAQTVRLFTDAKLRVTDISFERTADLNQVDIHLSIGFVDPRIYDALERQLERDQTYILLSTHQS